MRAESRARRTIWSRTSRASSRTSRASGGASTSSTPPSSRRSERREAAHRPTLRRGVDDARAGRREFARPDDDPSPVLVLLDLRVLGPVVVLALEGEPAERRVNAVGLEPGGKGLVVETPGGVDGGLEQEPGVQRSRRLAFHEGIR